MQKWLVDFRHNCQDIDGDFIVQVTSSLWIFLDLRLKCVTLRKKIQKWLVDFRHNCQDIDGDFIVQVTSSA